MTFLDRLFGRKKAPRAHEPLMGQAVLQTDEERAATRARMEADLDASAKQRGAPEDSPPSS